jgi:hypothetical protein
MTFRKISEAHNFYAVANKKKGKGNVVPGHAMKAQRGV